MFFTRFSKVFLILLMIVVIGISISIGALAEDADATYGIIAFLVGCLILMLFGMYVELCNNVLDIKRHIRGERDYYNVPNANLGGRKINIDNFYGKQNSISPYYGNYNYSNTNTLGGNSGSDSKPDTGSLEKVWYCRHCGNANKDNDNSNVCQSCGKSR
ncbi:MAG: hypothetical protein IJ224_02340 [Lachnospiraceae bacterium]|nr:hypothetical protein [Lachnospiraceae bacterium]